MEMYKEILINILRQENIEVSFPNLKIEPEKILSLVCYRALERIKEIIQNDDLDDAECFGKIEEVIQTMECFEINSGNRHDF